ncbi:hypothetical protein OG863_15860 [Streptomyces decoyicus]|uniref:DUF3885 domain-containing protein n=1 Tax=Streptomyces decoyicus TaxID=249567 RepID=A0ABZ1FGN4_9ACTN|nr:hypothetical protein [Streptomyces decoyicus]WSB69311.1 hypothetical protein OG863_15860 [Streptomyces decoyicus]
MSLCFDRAHLSTLWQRQRPMGPPLAHELRAAYSDRWVRFHSLPGSKRYPETEDEYTVVLDRNNTVLEELFAGTDVYVLTTAWSSEPTGPQRPTRRREVHPDSSPWMTITNDADPDPEFHTYTHLYADRRPWQRGSIDEILREVAHDALSGVIITDSELQRIHHPYDGGADVILTTPDERDEVRNRHTDWLSQHPTGL